MKIILLFLFSIVSFSQTQIGNDINGEAAGDESGARISISSDGTIVAIGAWRNDGNGVDSGHVRVYRNLSGVWTQIGSDINGAAANDYSGSSVSLSSDGTILAIGAWLNDGNGNGSGQVRVYRNVSNVWLQVGNAIYGQPADNLGACVVLSADGNTVAIGAIGNNTIAPSSGCVRVYSNISGVWTQIGNTIYGVSLNENTGSAIDISDDGNTLVIGVPANDINGDNSGYVRVYQNTLGTWTQIGNTFYGQTVGEQNGKSVSLSSNGIILAIGADGNDFNGENSGCVRVYRNISGTWIQIGSTIYGEAANDGSGNSISLSDDGIILAIGAYGNDGNGIDSGHVRIYRNVFGIWTQIGNDINGESSGDFSGSFEGIDLSSDGTILAIGAYSNDGNGNNSGHVRVYNLSAILNSDNFISDNFTLYPNPTSNIININLKDILVFEKATIYNRLGQIIKTENTKNINVSNLSSGTYFIEVITDKGKATKSFIKK